MICWCLAHLARLEEDCIRRERFGKKKERKQTAEEVIVRDRDECGRCSFL
jgi:hypothetical protein